MPWQRCRPAACAAVLKLHFRPEPAVELSQVHHAQLPAAADVTGFAVAVAVPVTGAVPATLTEAVDLMLILPRHRSQEVLLVHPKGLRGQGLGLQQGAGVI